MVTTASQRRADTNHATLIAVTVNQFRRLFDGHHHPGIGFCTHRGSSGKTIRHRLNRGGNRDADRALHVILVVRMRRHQLRCVKRYIARESYHAFREPSARTTELIA